MTFHSSFLSITDLSALNTLRRQMHQVVFMGLEIIALIIGGLALIAGVFLWFEGQKAKTAYNHGLANLEEERALLQSQAAQTSSKPAKTKKKDSSKSQASTEPEKIVIQPDVALAKEVREKEKALGDAQSEVKSLKS